MLTLFFKHGMFDLEINVGETKIDEHHLMEDIGISLGKVIIYFLGNKNCVCRYGFWLFPMDVTLIECVLDISGRLF